MLGACLAALDFKGHAWEPCKVVAAYGGLSVVALYGKAWEPSPEPSGKFKFTELTFTSAFIAHWILVLSPI